MNLDCNMAYFVYVYYSRAHAVLPDAICNLTKLLYTTNAEDKQASKHHQVSIR